MILTSDAFWFLQHVVRRWLLRYQRGNITRSGAGFEIFSAEIHRYSVDVKITPYLGKATGFTK